MRMRRCGGPDGMWATGSEEAAAEAEGTAEAETVGTEKAKVVPRNAGEMASCTGMRQRKGQVKPSRAHAYEEVQKTHKRKTGGGAMDAEGSEKGSGEQASRHETSAMGRRMGARESASGASKMAAHSSARDARCVGEPCLSRATERAAERENGWKSHPEYKCAPPLPLTP